MTHEFIDKILKREAESPIILDSCVLNIRKGRSVLYSLVGETDYIIRELEICYSDKHDDVIFKGNISTEQELERIILESLKH